MMSKTKLLTLICACFLFLSSNNIFAFSLIHNLPYQRSNGVTYTDAIATRDDLHTYYAYYDIPVSGSIPDIVRYGFDWGISFGCNSPACYSPGYHLYMITCDQNNNNCVDGYDTGTETQIVGSAVAKPTCWDNDHVAVSRGFIWSYDYSGLCGVGDVTADSLFPANYNITSGLIAYWKFDDPSNLGLDSSGYGNNGTISNSLVTYIAEGKQKGAAKFIEGSNAGIVVPNSASLNIQNSITITAWVNLDGQNTDNGNAIISRTGVYEPYAFFASLGGIGGEPQDNGAMGAYFWSSGVTSNYYVPVGQWTHLGMSYDGSIVKFYVNGALVSSVPSSTGLLTDNNANVFIGASPHNIPEDFSGLMDEVRLYNRALSEAEIQALYVEGSFKLPDTGQTACYDSSGSIIPCAGSGQDGEYTINPMSYSDNGDGTVTDNNTGLVWQKEDEGTFYNYYQAEGVYDPVYNSTSRNVCGELNLGGHSDWRLPSKKELISIVDYSIPSPGPTINGTFFPDTKSAMYASSTIFSLYPFPPYNIAWGVDFSAGSFSWAWWQNSAYVRCVRARQYPAQAFVNNGDGTITDNATGLMWQQGEPGLKSWVDALGYCESLELPTGSGQHDWRLPNIKELESITDDTRPNPANPNSPAINPEYFPNAYTNAYLSSTTMAGTGINSLGYLFTQYAWYVDFLYGENNDADKHYGGYVRCVRDGSGGSGTPADSDTDGLPDSWELHYFGDLVQNPGDDYDHDGLTNLQEYQLGTDPTKWDTDGDGLSDGWEINGIDIDNDGIIDVDLPAMGTDPLHKDIFVEIDYMNDPGFCVPILGCLGGHSHAPKKEALQIVINAFANAPVSNPDGEQGIRLHVDAGPSSIMNPVTGATWGNLSQSEVLSHNDNLGSKTSDGNYDWTEFDQIKANHFSEARRNVFHYCIFAHNLGGLGSTSGIARLPGNDLIVSLGSWTNQVGTVNEQAGTFMHELGHNLGLYHGGDPEQGDVNYKPNFLSIMNYSFQTRGLRINSSDAHFDYSRFQLPELDENSLNEPIGLNGGSAITNYGTRYYCPGLDVLVSNANNPIDWNCNFNFTEIGIAEDINQSKNGERTVLKSYNDWAHLTINGGAIGQLGAMYEPPIETAVNEITKEEDELLTTTYAVSINGPGTMLVCPGYQGAYSFTIKNSGQLPDTYSVVGTTIKGWTDIGSLVSEVSLNPGEELSYQIPINVPHIANVGEKDELKINVLSHANPNLLDSIEAISEVIACNKPPLAICKNMIVNADTNCKGNASIDGGSYDPDGNPIAITQSPVGPYSLGSTLVTLTVTDSIGASSSCTGTVTVVGIDSDGDGTPDCKDACPNDPNKITPGVCGCGVADTDTDKDGVPDCKDNCPNIYNPDQLDSNGNGIGDVCESKTICSILGNNPKPSIPDVDIFKFSGTKGETVKIRIEANPPEAGSGKRVTLILTDKIKGTVLLKLDLSVLPNEITEKLPATGEYLITVAEQVLTTKDKRFKGDYCLTLKARPETYQTLAPYLYVE